MGAAIWGVLYLPIHSVTGVWQRRLAERVLDSTAELPPHFREIIESSQGAGGLVFGLVFGLMFMLVVGGAFSTLGGLLGAMLFRKDAPPPPLGPPAPPPFVLPPPPVVPPAPPAP